MFIYLINSSVDTLANMTKAIDFSRNVPAQNQLCCQSKNPEEGHGWGLRMKWKQWHLPPWIWADLRTLNSRLCTSASLREPGRLEPAEVIFNWMGQLWLMMTMDTHPIAGQILLSTALFTHSEQGCWFPRLLAWAAHTQNLSEAASESWQPRLTPENCFSCLVQLFLFFWNCGLLPNPITLALFPQKPHWRMSMQRGVW